MSDAPREVDAATAPRNDAATALAPGPWAGLGTVVFYALLQVALGALVLGATAVLHAALKQYSSLQLSADGLDELMSDPRVMVWVNTVTLALSALGMYAFVRRCWPGRLCQAAPPGFGVARPRRRYWLHALLAGLGMSLAVPLLQWWLSPNEPVKQDVVVQLMQVTGGYRLLLILQLVAFAPLAEELVFRGVLLSGLMARARVAWAIVGSSLVFGAVHLPGVDFQVANVTGLIVFGAVLAWLRLRSASLWPGVLAHAVFNSVAVLLVGTGT